MPLDPILIERFALLFAGLTRAKGRYVSTTDPSQLVVGDKSKGKATTITETVTVEDYRRHLEGELGLGIVPIRDDGTCVFGAIDVDQYAGLDHQAIVEAIRKYNIPAIVCRSKSGGAHIYVFIQEPGIKAAAFIEYLKKVRSQLGIDYRKAREIFPKQAKQSGGIGNWINLPYFGDSLRRAVKDDGSYMTLEEFINTVQRVDASTLAAASASEDGLVLTELPPCLERLAQDGIPAGMRNEALFNFTVFACKKYHMDRRKTTALLDVINMRVCQPPVPSNELRQTLDSVLKHEYNYRCDISPLVDVCDKSLCAQRPFGPSCSMHSGDLPEIEWFEIRGEETNETVYAVKLVVVPKPVSMDSKTLGDYELFRRAVQDQAHVRLPDAKKKDWDAYLTARWESLKKVVRSAPERSKKGVLVVALEDWIRMTATTEAERFSLGRPLLEGNSVFIGISDLYSRLKLVQPRLEYAAVVSLLEDSSWEKCTKIIAGRTYDNVWTKAINDGEVATEKEVVKEVDGHIVVETPKDLPAGTFEEYDDFSKFQHLETDE
jgi:hypothetical protein